MMELPTDPMMLFSFVNTKLRDNYKACLCRNCRRRDSNTIRVKINFGNLTYIL